MKEQNLLSQSITKISFPQVIRFIIPTYLATLFTTMYTIVDGIFVSAYVGTNALAAINIVYPIVNLLTGIALMFAVGGSSWAAIYLGKKDISSANEIFFFCIVVILLFGIVISGGLLLQLPEVLSFLGATVITKEYCTIYAKIWLWGTPVVMLKEIFVYFIRVDGNPFCSFLISAAGGILNLILDYFFVGYMKLGIWGAGIATILGLVLSTVFGILYFTKYSKNIKFYFGRIHKKFFPMCMMNGSSECINQLAIAITTIVFNKTALQYAGDDGVAAVSIIMYVQFIFLGIYTGYSMGISPLLGYSYGNNNQLVCKKLEKYSYRFFGIVPILLYGIAFFAAPFLVLLFAAQNSTVYSLAVPGMRIYSIGYFFAGWSIFTAIRFTSYGHGQYSAVITFLRSFLLLLLFLSILPQICGINGMWMAVPVAEFVTCLVTICLIFYVKDR